MYIIGNQQSYWLELHGKTIISSSTYDHYSTTSISGFVDRQCICKLIKEADLNFNIVIGVNRFENWDTRNLMDFPLYPKYQAVADIDGTTHKGTIPLIAMISCVKVHFNDFLWNLTSHVIYT